MVRLAAFQKICQQRQMFGAHFFFNAIGAKGFDGAAHEHASLVKAVAQGIACIEKEMRPEHLALLADLLKRGEADHLAKPEQFKRYGSARKLYTFNIDNASSY